MLLWPKGFDVIHQTNQNLQAIRIFLIGPNLVKMLIYKPDLPKKDHDSA
jgi:hypothetical protein